MCRSLRSSAVRDPLLIKTFRDPDVALNDGLYGVKDAVLITLTAGHYTAAKRAARRPRFVSLLRFSTAGSFASAPTPTLRSGKHQRGSCCIVYTVLAYLQLLRTANEFLRLFRFSISLVALSHHAELRAKSPPDRFTFLPRYLPGDKEVLCHFLTDLSICDLLCDVKDSFLVFDKKFFF